MTWIYITEWWCTGQWPLACLSCCPPFVSEKGTSKWGIWYIIIELVLKLCLHRPLQLSICLCFLFEKRETMQKEEKMLENAEKSIFMNFLLCAAPKSWLKYTTVVHVNNTLLWKQIHTLASYASDTKIQIKNTFFCLLSFWRASLGVLWAYSNMS